MSPLAVPEKVNVFCAVCLRRPGLARCVDDDEVGLAGHDVLRQREGCRVTVAGKGLEGDVTIWVPDIATKSPLL